jgi:nucleoside-diphosphate-sugar epimerase
MDYFGPPSAPSQLKVLPILVDHQSRKAIIPGDGNTPVVLTHSTDVGKFVAAALDIPQWQEVSLVVGDKLTLNELVKHAEAAAGSSFAPYAPGADKNVTNTSC